MNTKDAIQRAVAAYLSSFDADPIPKGWYTMKQLADHHGTGIRNMGLIVRKLKEAKQVESKEYKVQVGKGIQRVPYYRLSQSAAKAFGLTTAKH
jgi:hypothetical protein